MSRRAAVVDDLGEDPVAADAAAWLVALQATPRRPDVEAAFRAWLSGDDERVTAFSRATEVWEALGGVAPTWEARMQRRGRQRRALAGGATAAVLLAAVGIFAMMPPAYSTKIGEQRVVRLTDGTAVTLNTATKITVSYRQGGRQVELDRGEAFFDVARDTSRPFVVLAGDEQVKALGTTFIVRRGGPRDVEVTLLSGIVDVSRAEGAKRSGPVTLSPGQRLRTDGATSQRIDRPQLERVMAWRHGELLLDETPLDEAVAEMNRYNKRPIVLENAPLEQLRISGVVKTGDSASFARTVSALYGMPLRETKESFLLTGVARRR